MFDLDRAEALLDRLVDEHDALMDVAHEGFGVRTAALPKGLMSIKEAQRVLVDLEKNLQKVVAFHHGLINVRDIPTGMEAEFKALLDKAYKATQTCATDKKKAVDALATHEDLLVGEAFQEMFQEVRLAIIDFDVADDVDLDFKTTLFLDAEPAYATGAIHVKKGGQDIYVVSVGYRAEDELFYGNISIVKRHKTFKEVVRKNGRTKLPAFVRGLTDQLKALADQDAAGVFKSRKKVELTLVDTEAVKGVLRPALEAAFKKQITVTAPTLTVSLEVNSTGTSATGQCYGLGNWGWRDVNKSVAEAHGRFNYLDKQRVNLSAPFSVTLPSGQVWDVVPTVGPWKYSTMIASRSKWLDSFVFTTFDELERAWPIEWSDQPKSLAQTTIAQLQARATVVGVPFDPKSKDKASLLKALQVADLKPVNLQLSEGTLVRFTVTARKVVGKAAQRVASRFLSRTAGATTFEVYHEGEDAGKAYRAAVAEAAHERGHDPYSGTIATGNGYRVARDEPFIVARRHGSIVFSQELNSFIERNQDRYDKWGPCGAVPVSVEQVLASETVTVMVDAKDEVEARRKGTLLIKATGRIPPKASIVVEVPEGTKGLVLENKGARVSTWKVTGLRKQSLTGQITGWVFFGWAAS